MAALPPKMSQLEGQLRRWVEAGLISKDQAALIRTAEASAVAGEADVEVAQAVEPSSALPRPSGIELLAYLGVGVALAGVLTLVYSSAPSLAFTGAFTSSLGAAGLISMYAFSRVGRAAAMRAAGACLGLAAAGLGVGAGELASAASLFTKTMVVSGGCGLANACPPYTSTSQWGNIVLGAGVGVAVAVGLIRYVPGPVAAIVSVVATYTAATAAIGLTGLEAQSASAEIGLILVLASACLAAFGETLRRQPAVHAFYGFVGVVGASVPLYLLGGAAPGAHSDVHLDVIGGIIAAIGLATGITIPRAGIAYGAVVGLAGLVLDIGIRNFHTSTSIGIFLTLFGTGVVATLVGVSHLLRTRGKVLS